MICHHFNLSYLQVNEDLPLGDFWCLLAESLDADELGDYRDALLMHGKEVKKKWKWQTPDHAGTRPMVKQKDVRRSMLSFAAALTGRAAQKTGTIEEIARVKNLPMVYRDEEGNLFDEHGNRVESKPGLVFIPLPR